MAETKRSVSRGNSSEPRSVRSAEGIERRKAQARERYRARYTDPAFRAKERERRRKYAEANREAEIVRSRTYYENNKEREIANRKEWSRQNKERQLETQRRYYAANKDRLKELIRENRKRRNPTIGLERAIQDCIAGRITVDELVRLNGLALVRLDARVNSEQTASRHSKVQPRRSERGLQLRKKHSGNNETKTRRT